MSTTAAYFALLTGIVVWAVLVSRFTAKPWEPNTGGNIGRLGDEQIAPGAPAARVGLWVFLAVITSLFCLFMLAYFMRMWHGQVGSMPWM
mgnify:CR=1 FL=1